MLLKKKKTKEENLQTKNRLSKMTKKNIINIKDIIKSKLLKINLLNKNFIEKDFSIIVFNFYLLFTTIILITFIVTGDILLLNLAPY